VKKLLCLLFLVCLLFLIVSCEQVQLNTDPNGPVFAVDANTIAVLENSANAIMTIGVALKSATLVGIGGALYAIIKALTDKKKKK